MDSLPNKKLLYALLQQQQEGLLHEELYLQTNYLEYQTILKAIPNAHWKKWVKIHKVLEPAQAKLEPPFPKPPNLIYKKKWTNITALPYFFFV